MEIDIHKEREAFDEYFKEKYPELYKDVFNEDGDERAIIGYSFALSAWQARAKAQTVPEGYIIVPLRDLNIVMELAEDHRNEYVRTSEFPEVHKAIHDVKAMIEAQEST